MEKIFLRISFAAALLALVVIVLGAYVRLSDAGLGCPDWPGCYGKLLAPTATADVAAANLAFPEQPVESPKAWKEMIHRYFASTLGLFILALAGIAWKQRRTLGQQVKLPLFLVILVAFQGALGMWTVTLLLKPAIVTLHLLGGMLTLALLWWSMLTHWQNKIHRDKGDTRLTVTPMVKRWALLALIVVYCQIALGGWTSTNYVALHCWDLPTCQGQWLPPTDFREGFTLWREVGVNYEGGVLSREAGTAVHLTHRIGAVITFFVVGGLSLALFFSGSLAGRRYGALIAFALCVQISLGLLNILLVLPIAVAVAHNGGAAVLLLSLVTVHRRLKSHPIQTQATPANKDYSSSAQLN
ncbi:cytochrome B [Gammaproteobacteria bacterium 42_54_T18]|nr:cytochrome B [Gammaproteobacteria bacterium 42_54_T18]